MATSALENLDNRRESDDTFSLNQSGESPPKTQSKTRHQQRKKKNWRLRHLAEK